MFVCSFHEHIRVVIFITLHVFFVFCVVMCAFAFVHVILFDDICLFVCRSGLVPLDADNPCLIIQL